jgi:DNA gyrase/topoisomerase IV subunit A
VAAAAVVSGDVPLLLLTDAGATKALRVRSVPKMDRPAQGRSLITLRKKERVRRMLVL